MSRGTIIDFDRQKFADLKEAYTKAVREGKDTFEFVEKKGNARFSKPGTRHQLVTAFAKHLIDHLETEFANHPDIPARPYREGEEGQ